MIDPVDPYKEPKIVTTTAVCPTLGFLRLKEKVYNILSSRVPESAPGIGKSNAPDDYVHLQFDLKLVELV